ncbi:hypothetical protein AIOL_004736 [Candidatus Rhodobacter oscarellae]|uniref:Lipoprotein n=1 Tax=Candidatus Rhodobacter oscarellae TaxID=1675527 RepID=A0A0J9H215_9RHOB|nr:hypothetical protein [Candidatus Rhodobacter lobularis]KMW59753.1 hypothetical protein AIOL_004736 [Candidatus Rhodobacter lobularis]
MRLLLIILALVASASVTQAQRSFTAQEIANGGGIIHNREIRQKVVQGPTMTFRDVGKGNIGYAMWGYVGPKGPYFRLVGLPYKSLRKVDAVSFEGVRAKPEFTPQKRFVNIQIGFGMDVYRHGLRNGLTVNVSGDVEKSFTVPKEYFQGFNAWWNKRYP